MNFLQRSNYQKVFDKDKILEQMNKKLSLYFRGKQHNWLAPTFPEQQALEEGSTALINLSSQL